LRPARPVGPTVSASATATAMCSLTPKVSILLYDVVGPYLSISPAVKATAATDVSSLTWELDGSLHAELGVDKNPSVPGLGNLFSVSGLDHANVALYDQTWTLAKGP
jgi:hypothetical protein